MSIEGQGHFSTIYFQGFVCFVLYKANISGERLQDHWSSGLLIVTLPLTIELRNRKDSVELIIDNHNYNKCPVDNLNSQSSPAQNSNKQTK